MGLLAIAVATAMVWLLLRPVLPFRLISLILTVGAAWPIVALFTKRLHDRGKAAAPSLAIYLGPTAVLSVLQQLSLGYAWSRSGYVYPLDFWPNMLSFLALITFMVGLFEGLFMPPERGRNAYGPDPRIFVSDT